MAPVGERERMAVMEGSTSFDAMSPVACRRRLSQETVGRLAVIVDDHPEVFPVNYVMADDRVVIRVDPGAKLNALIAHPAVAFEIDGVDEERRNGWSVLVVGHADLVTDPGEREKLASEVWPDPWVGGSKEHLIVIRPDSITGRYLLHHHPR